MRKFLTTLTVAALGAGVAYATKHLVDKNGGIQPTLDKAKNTFDKAKDHPAVASAIAMAGTVFSDLKSRVANDQTDRAEAA